MKRPVRLLFAACLLLRSAERASGQASSDTDLGAAGGPPLERMMNGGEAHGYSFRMAVGDYVSIAVDQRGIDVVASLYAPGGRKLLETDSPTEDFGREIVRWVAVEAGNHRLELHSLESDANPGCYEIRVEALRPATPNDRVLASGEVAYCEAWGLDQEQTAASQRKALESYFKALALFRRGGDVEREALSLDCVGVDYAALGEYPAALDYFQEAVLMGRAAGDESVEAHALFMMGTLETSMGSSGPALRHYEDALAIERRLGALSMEAEILSNYGQLHDSLGQESSALDLYERSLALSRATRNHELEARLLNRLGNLYLSAGDKGKALAILRQALAVSRSGSDRTLEALILSSLGRLLAELGDAERALRSFDQALDIVRRNGDRHAEASILFEAGRCKAGVGRDASAREDFSAALPLVRTVNDPHLEAAVLNGLGNVLARAGETDKALSFFDQGLVVAAASNDPYGEARLRTSRGSLLGRLGLPVEGLEDLRQASLIWRGVQNPLGGAATAYEAAVIERGRGRSKEARSFVEDAVAAVESVRGRLFVPDLRATFAGSVERYYDLYADIVMDGSGGAANDESAAAALRISEQAKARTLLELLTEAGADIRTGVEAALLEREHSVRSRLKARIEGQIRASGPFGTDRVQASPSEIDTLTDELRDIEGRIRERSPRYAELTQARALDLASIQRESIDDDTLLLEYMLGDSRSFLWVVSRASLWSFLLPPRAVIEDSARRVYELWKEESPNGSPPGRDRARQEALALSRMVIGPAATLLGRKRLLIVGDGALVLVPFAALPVPSAVHEPEGRVLLDDHEIVHLPSASVLALQRRDFTGRVPPAKALVVLADPVFDRGDPRFRTHERGAEAGSVSLVGIAASGAGLELSRLPMTRREASAILRLVPISERKEALDFAASVATAKGDDIANYRYLHFATHGLIYDQQPELSGVVLSLFDSEGREQEGLLSTLDVLNLKLPIELVVLSACRTGLGREIRGEGLVGLVRSFMYAGAARVVSTLWKVDDAATAALMARFYEGMLGARRLTPAAALREAQAAIKRQKRWRNPSYWAAFTLQGEWR